MGPDTEARLAVEDFVFREADLLDRWKLEEWEKLLTEDAEYLIPPIGVANPELLSRESTLFIIADDRSMLAARVLRLGGFVNCTPEFTDMPQVVNGASDLMVQVFGDAGKHARAAVGVSSLPLGVAVEVEAMFELA